MNMDIDCAYQYLKHAEIGYEKEIFNGSTMYQDAYEGVKKLLKDKQFDSIRDKYDALFDDDEC